MRVRDEVCRMTIRKSDAAAKTEFDGRMYFFCSERCRVKFEEHPGWYMQGRDEPEEDADPVEHRTAADE
jgi:YHS domain-containing protein